MTKCDCYISKMGINCERIADILLMVMSPKNNNTKDAQATTLFLESLVADGTITLRECIIVATQVGIHSLTLGENPDHQFTFSDN